MPVFWRRVFIFLISLLPLGFLIFKASNNLLGADPQKVVVTFIGTWAFYFLLLTLTASPLKKITKQHWVMVHRRMLGLFTLFYAMLHIFSYLIFILGWDFSNFGAEVIKRPYILLTLPAIFLLLALGITSPQVMMRKLGKNWVRLHKCIYLIALLAWVHVLLQVRSSYANAFLFGVFTALLLGIRVYWHLKKIYKHQPS
jgi:methionine sulfoxide reductase heme-binding subunit